VDSAGCQRDRNRVLEEEAEIVVWLQTITFGERSDICSLHSREPFAGKVFLLKIYLHAKRINISGVGFSGKSRPRCREITATLFGIN